MYRAGNNARPMARALPFLLLLTIFQGVIGAHTAHAGTQAPTVTISEITGVTAKTGAGDANAFASQVGRTITFKVTLSVLTANQLPTGQIRIVDAEDRLRRIFCITSTFTMSGTSATASCSWTPTIVSGFKFAAQYLTNPQSATDYSYAISTATERIYLAGIVNLYGLDGNIETGTTRTIIAETYYDFSGQISFYANGSPISGCQNVNINGSQQASCSYLIPTNAKTIIFTFDYTPGSSVASGLTLQRASFPKEVTVGSYYYPNETNWYTRTGVGYNTSFNATTLANEFHQHDNIFYKLNASTGQAIVVSYNRTAFGGTSLVIPEAFTVSTLGGVFNRTYTVTQIGPFALSIVNGANGSPTTLLTSITIPNTVTLIGNSAFAYQCNIRTLTIPDSVRVIGTDALTNMRQSNGVSACASGVTGLETLTVGSGLETIGDNAMKFLGGVKAITFRGSPDSMVPVLSNPAGFDAFQWGTAFDRQKAASSIGVNACGAVVTYSNTVTAYLMGSQANAWRFWATADSCITNSGLQIVNTQFAPSAPLQPIADTPTTSSLMVSWQAPLNDGDSAITGYSIQYSSNSGSTWTQSSCTSCQLGSSPYLVSGLAADTSYIFRVVATNAIGNSSPSVPSLPARTSAYTNAPAFTISPAAETVTAGSATTYALTSTYPASSYAISPAARNGLSFNTSTGALTGTLSAVETAVAYAVTGTNIVGSRTETYTVTVIAAPAAPHASTQVSVPDPVQTSRVTTISQRCIKPDNIIDIQGNFNAKILNIAINGKTVPASQWSQSAELVTIKWANNFNSNIEIQIYNGQVPILTVQRLAYVDQCALEEVKVVAPTPSPTPTKVVNTQPAAEMKKISMLYFALGSYLVSKPNKVQVAKIAAEIMNSPVETVLIYGHTDSQGGVDNIALSKNRAKAIVAQIKPLLKGKSIRIGWYAATKPVATGKSKAAYAQNRRVEIWVK